MLGSLLIKSTIHNQIEGLITGDDFTDERLGIVFDNVIVMAARGDHVDAAIVNMRLSDWGVKGLDAEPFAWTDGVYEYSVRDYAMAVHAASIRRRTELEISTARSRLQDGEDPTAVTSDLATRTKEIATGNVQDGLRANALENILQLEAKHDWVFPDLLERQDRLVVTGGEGSGKALALDTPIPTPMGWSTMGDLNPGDEVLGADGRPTRVTFATEVQYGRECFRVEFTDGTSIVADADHNWLTEDYSSRTKKRGIKSVVTTKQIAETLHARGGFTLNHSIDAAEPLQLPEVALPVSPYVLGAWLGDGHSAAGRMTIGDEDAAEMRDIFAAEGWPLNGQQGNYLYGVKGLRFALRELGVLGDKHIPEAYLRASYGQRLALFQGLMDTDGHVGSDGFSAGRGHGVSKCEFSVCNEKLARGFHELALSLGIITTWRPSNATLYGRVTSTRYRFNFQTELPVFRLERKAVRLAPLRTLRSRRRFVTAVVPVESVPVKCIQVDNADRMYLAGEQMVPTHNTTLVRQMAVAGAAGIHPLELYRITPVDVLVIDAENTEMQWKRQTERMVDVARSIGVRDPAKHIHVVAGKRLDISKGAHLSQIHKLIDEYDPKLVLIGPLYKLVPNAINNDTDAAPLIVALDSLRERGVALVMEAHAGKAENTAGQRNMAPRGSAALLGWPETGIGLRQYPDNPDVSEVVRWRGDREERSWPQELFRSYRGFPWSKEDPAGVPLGG